MTPVANEHARRLAAASKVPLVAILRGLAPARAAGTVRALVDIGFRIVEVPLNGEGALDAIAAARAAVAKDIVVGAGTVVTRDHARAAHAAGAELLVAPNLDAGVIEEGLKLGLAVMPGVLTPSEAFAAVGLGVHALKLFPAEIAGPDGLKALRAVLPKKMAAIYPVGGVTPETLRDWHEAGADGFGIGGALFKPTFSDDEVTRRARAFVAAWRAIEGNAA